jgi:hypothetical protein
MRVKLAVQVLNSKVQKEMAKYENEATESTRKFKSNCDALCNVFNDTKSLMSLDDTRIEALDDVLDFFKNWKNELASINLSQKYHPILLVGNIDILYALDSAFNYSAIQKLKP